MKKQMFYALAFALLLAPSLFAQSPEARMKDSDKGSSPAPPAHKH